MENSCRKILWEILAGKTRGTGWRGKNQFKKGSDWWKISIWNRVMGSQPIRIQLGKILWENLAGNLVGKSCWKILQENLVGKYCGKFLWENLVGNYCRKPCGKFLCDNLAGNPCRKILWDILVGKYCRKFLQKNLVGKYCGKILGDMCTVSFKSICRSGANPEKVLRIRRGATQVYHHDQ